jgi:hypothetical protein
MNRLKLFKVIYYYLKFFTEKNIAIKVSSNPTTIPAKRKKFLLTFMAYILLYLTIKHCRH